MKLRHWSGYGCIEATKVKDNSCTLHVVLKGDHEQGLIRNDLYDMYRFLVQRFDKSLKDVPEIDWERHTKRKDEYGFEDYNPPRMDIKSVNYDEVHYRFWY